MAEIKYGAAMLDFELPTETLEKYYNKLVPYKVLNGKRKLAIKRELTRSWGYLYNMDDTLTPKSWIDEDFLSEKTDAHLIVTMSAIGVHSCAFRLCFKPDIVEVCNLLSMHLDVEKLDKLDRIYVTTVPYPDHFADCVLCDGSGYYGETTYHMVYNTKTDPIQVESDL